MTRQRGLWLSLAVLALLLLGGRAAAGVYADYRWFDALGATDAWRLQFWNGMALRGAAFAIGALFAGVNLWGVRHSVVSLVLPRRIANLEIGEEVPGRVLMGLVVGLAVILGVGFAALASDWLGFTLAYGGVPFRETDPYFGADVGYFVYWLPFERSVFAWSVLVTSVVTAVVFALYALTPSLRWDRGQFHVSAYVRRHTALLVGLAIALYAWSFRLDAYAALTAGSGPDGAFGAYDHQFRLPISMVLAYATVGTAFVVAWAGWTGQTRIALAVAAALLLLAPLMLYGLPEVVRWASAPVDPATRERPYLADRNGYTRRAFGVDRIRTLPDSLALRSVADAGVAGVWDPAPLNAALERTRRRGRVVGGTNLVWAGASPTTVSVEAAPVGAGVVEGTWVVHRALAAVTDERGALVRIDTDGNFPVQDAALGPVLIHEGARGTLLVGDTLPPPAAPLLHTLGARFAEAWSDQNLRLLSRGGGAVRVVRRRDVRERVRTLVPFFAQGTRVTPIVHGDSLLWAVELYTTTVHYPLARRFAVIDGEVAYFRHAATALVHAYTGRVSFIPVEDPDPIAQTWMRRLPRLLARPTGLAPSLLAALPPDVDGTELLAEAFAATGARGEAGPRRYVPPYDGSDSVASSHAATLVWLGTMGASAWTLPLLEADERVSGVIVARGGAQRGVYWHPVRSPDLVWGALLERLRDASVEGTSMLEDPGAAGRLRLLPARGGGWVAVQPFYWWPPDAPPRVRRVVVATADSTMAARSLASAVGVPELAGPIPAGTAALDARIRELYAEMRGALQRGDWLAFGDAFEALGRLLGRR